MYARTFLLIMVISTIFCFGELDFKLNIEPEKLFKLKFFTQEFNKYKGDLNKFLEYYRGTKFIITHSKELKEIYQLYKSTRKIQYDQNGTATIGIHDGAFYYSFYYSEIEIGTPPKIFKVNVDAGSADLWVPAYNCTGCEGKNKYFYNESNTYTSDDATPFTIFYGGGREVAGNLVKDDVIFGGLEVKQQIFAQAWNNLNPFYESPLNAFDGIIGMGYPKLAFSHATPFMFNLKAQGVIEHNEWSLHLTTTFENLRGTGSKITIGDVNHDYYTGNFSYHQILNIEFSSLEGFWVFEGGSINFGGINNTIQVKNFAVDTGNNDAFDYPVDQNPNLPSVNSNCVGIESLPTIIITIGQESYPLEYNHYVFKIGSQGEESCTLLINPYGPWLGIGFITKYYTKFDYDNHRIGFALNKI